MQLYGLIGEKLSHSLSPKIHKLILEYIKEEGSYKLFEVKKKDLNDFTKALKALNIKGCNVTIPYKEEIIKNLDNISTEAKEIGAINTIALVDNKLYGYNTDYYGFGYMLEYNNIKVEDKIGVILGNGGACKACIQYLVHNSIKKIYVVSRNSKKDVSSNKHVEIISYDELRKIKGCLLINSTPVGMYPNVGVSLVDEDIIKDFEILVDLIYNPKETEFLRRGKNLNKRTIGGLFMLIGQAVKAQEIWNNRQIDKDVIKYIYNEIKDLV